MQNEVSTTRRVSGWLLAAALFSGIGACSDDDDGVPTGPVTSAGGGGQGGAGQGGGGTGGNMGPFDGVDQKVVIYQLVVRLFGNTNETRAQDGTLAENGSGTFADIDESALAAIKGMGATHVWLTGVLRQATLTDHGPGLEPDDADVVKGRAGSFYAVRDYYDVSPDYAVDPAARMAEFEALVDRIHAADMKVMIDLVPNHVARGYGSVVHPERDFGAEDDTSAFFSPANNFFYLADPPGQALALTKPPAWNPPGAVFDGAFQPEDGQAGRVPKATGNNVTSPTPSATDWYETIKLNYGYNFADPPASVYDPMPSTWTKVDEILAYWQEKGVDGFRCDFAHYVPTDAWSYLIEQVKLRDPDALVMAEAYENLGGLLGSGFDAVYHDAAYDTLKRMYLGAASMNDLDQLLGSFDDPSRGQYLNYLENHDERRIASPLVPGDNPDATGFGSANAGRQLAPLLFLYSQGPILVYNGQEVGEPGAGAEGFGGDDGRTTIFDYWSMPEMVKWVNGHAYDGGGLSAEQKSLRAYYSDLLALAQAPEIRGKRFWGLQYINSPGANPDANANLFSFARFATDNGSLILVVTNFGTGKSQSGPLRVPDDLSQAAGLPATVDLKVTLLLDGSGAKSDELAATTREALASAGLVVDVADQATNVYRVSP